MVRKQQVLFGEAIDSLDSIKDYFSINVVQFEEDYENNTFTEKKYPVRECIESDFGDHEHAKEMFSIWKGFLLICPDLKEDDVLMLEGTHSSM